MGRRLYRRCQHAQSAGAPALAGGKKKLARLARQAARSGRRGRVPSAREWLTADLGDAGQVIREGHDFRTQQELSALVHAPDGGFSAARGRPEAEPLVVRLIQEALRDLQMFERTGQLPGGASYSELPAYKVALYRAYWQHSA